MQVCVASVIQSDVTKQIGHGLSVVDAPDGLSQDHTDIHSFDFWTLQLLDLMRYSVGHHHLEVQYDSLRAFVSACFHDYRDFAALSLVSQVALWGFS